MKVKDLKKELEKYNDEDLVVIARGDCYGEWYNLLNEIEDWKYLDWEVYLKELTEEHIKDWWYTEEDIWPKESEDCIVLRI